MKIVYLLNARIPTEKAYGYAVAKMCEAYADAGASVELWAPYADKTLGRDVHGFYGVRPVFVVRFFDSFNWNRLPALGSVSHYLQGALMARRSMRSLEKDTVVITRDLLVAGILGQAGHLVILDAHYLPEANRRLMHWALGHIKGIIANSQGTAEAFAALTAAPALAVPNGVDLREYEGLPDRTACRARCALPPDKKIALYAGHLYAWKGIETLVAAAKHLAADPAITLVLIGGTAGDIARYREYIREHKIGNILMLGYKPKPEIPLFLAAADVLVLPNTAKSSESKNYTSPLKLFDYMASRRPVAASDLPSIREIVNERNALLVSPDDPAALADGIRRLLDDPALGERLATQAFADVREYTWEKRAKKIVAFITATVKAP